MYIITARLLKIKQKAKNFIPKALNCSLNLTFSFKNKKTCIKQVQILIGGE